MYYSSHSTLCESIFSRYNFAASSCLENKRISYLIGWSYLQKFNFKIAFNKLCAFNPFWDKLKAAFGGLFSVGYRMRILSDSCKWRTLYID